MLRVGRELSRVASELRLGGVVRVPTGLANAHNVERWHTLGAALDVEGAIAPITSS